MSAENGSGREAPAAPTPGIPLPFATEPLAMSRPRQRRTIVIGNEPIGLHMRPVTAFAQLADRFQCAVLVSKEGRTVNGKSSWDMMSMLSPPGTELTVETEGPDAGAALEALVGLLINLSDTDETAPVPKQ